MIDLLIVTVHIGCERGLYIEGQKVVENMSDVSVNNKISVVCVGPQI